MQAGRAIGVAGVALAAGLVPLLVIHACYLASAWSGQVPWCFPYLDGCTSISRAARQAGSIHLFKGTMLPYSAMLLLHWWLAARWLAVLMPEAPVRRRSVALLGMLGAVFLALYVTFLGVDGNPYDWLRRYGTTVHFASTTLAQILLMAMLVREPRIPRWVRQGKLGLCAGMLFLGLLSIPLRFLVDDLDAAQNAVEWCYWLLAVAYLPLTGVAWRVTGFTVRTGLEGNGWGTRTRT